MGGGLLGSRDRSRGHGSPCAPNRPQLVFFDAPVGLIFTIHSALTKHSWLDYGLFLQTLMLAAQVRGLATCPQVSFVRFQPIIAEQLGLGAEELVTCGMSCGYSDEQAAVNRLNMPREPLDGFTRWLGFDELNP